MFIANGLAGMGIALPTAIAAKLVHPQRKVVTVNGDGGFLMNVQELETAVRLRTPIVNVIWENGQFGSIVWKQDKKFGRHFGTDFTNPDFVALADAFGMPAWRIEAVDDFAPDAAPRARARRAVADRAADRLLDGRRHLGRTRNGDGRRMSTITQIQEQAAVEAVPTQLFIGGEWRDASGGATLGVEDPSTGETIAEVADATPEDAAAALDACVAVQEEWAAHPPRERGEILRRAFEAVTERADELALVMTLEMGKPLAESKAEVDLRGRVPALVRRGGGADRGPLRDAPQRPGPAASPCASRSGRATRSRRGTSRWRWARARSARPSRPAARW